MSGVVGGNNRDPVIDQRLPDGLVDAFFDGFVQVSLGKSGKESLPKALEEILQEG
jgi:hypothetical protein